MSRSRPAYRVRRRDDGAAFGHDDPVYQSRRKRAIAIDAVRAEPADPGRIHELSLETVAQSSFRPPPPVAMPWASERPSGWGSRRTGSPRRLHVYAIEGQDFGFGQYLSMAAVDAVAGRVLDLLGEPVESG